MKCNILLIQNNFHATSVRFNLIPNVKQLSVDLTVLLLKRICPDILSENNSGRNKDKFTLN